MTLLLPLLLLYNSELTAVDQYSGVYTSKIAMSSKNRVSVIFYGVYVDLSFLAVVVGLISAYGPH